jgi:ATP-dependent helicase/nuclease subunit A
VRVARAALAYVADPGDRLAALTWLTLGPQCMPIEDALRNAVDQVLETHVAFEPLKSLHEGGLSCPVVATVAEILQTTSLRDWAAGLDNPAQALADLARLEAEAQTFDALAPDLRGAAGFHGCSLQIFLGWIVAQTNKAWDKHPDPDGWSSSGIEISTWHSAKGREWPITVVASLDQIFAERPGTLSAEFDGFDDLENVLSRASLGYLPDFAAPETQAIFAAAHQEQDEQEAARELYVALTRARDRLILALPREKSKPRDRAERMIDLLRDRGGLQASGGFIEVCGQQFAASVSEAVADEPDNVSAATTTNYLRFGTPRQAVDAHCTPWRQSPSTLEPSASQVPLTLDTVAIGTAIDTSGETFTSAADRGTILHLAFRVLTNRPELSQQLATGTGLSSDVIDEIKTQADTLRNRLAGEGYDKLHFELPVQEIRPDGSQTNAIIDCLAEGTEGFVILDHKSGPCPDPEARFLGYLPQLQSYAQLMAHIRPDKPVRGLAINWIDEGKLSFCPVDEKEFA